MGTIKTTNIETITGSGTLTLGQSGETISIPTNTTLGASGSTITIPSGCIITNNGTQTGFGGTMTPAFQAYRSGNQTISNSTYTKMNYNAEIFDTDGCYDNSTNYRFTPTEAGKYFLYAQVQSQDTTDINDNFISIRKNGTDIAFNNTPHLHYHTKAVSGIAVANGTSDYFEVFVFNNTGGSSFTMYGVDESSYFGGYKIIE